MKESITSPDSSRRSTRALVILTTLAIIGALKWTASVTLPLAFAIFMIAVFWPLQRSLEPKIGRAPAALTTLFVFLCILGLFCGALWYSVDLVASDTQKYQEEWKQYAEQLQGYAKTLGLSGGGDSTAFLQTLSERFIGFIGASVLVLAFFVLGLLEVRDYRIKIDRGFRRTNVTDWLEPVHRITSDFQRYIVVRTVLGLITGALVAVFAWLIGLDFAFIWGLTNFLLNYIPTLGSVIGIVPPTLFALAQYQNIEMTLLTLAVVGGVQLIMGNYIDPLMQGKYLALSPLVVLLSVVFWGWLWGIAGAFIGVPLTVGIVITCRQFERTRWIAVLLASRGEIEQPKETS